MVKQVKYILLFLFQLYNNNQEIGVYMLIKDGKQYKDLFNMLPDAIFVIDVKTGDILEANDVAVQMYGYTMDELLNMNNLDLSFERTLTQAAMRKGVNFVPLRIHRRKDGTIFPTEITANYTLLNKRDVLTSVVRDISNREDLERRVLDLGFRDKLTGFYSRTFYEEEIHRLKTGRNYPVSIIFIDIDGLKTVNDNYGHKAGDRQIKDLGIVIGSDFRNEDSISRIGGDEFVILLPKTNNVTVKKIVNRIRDSIVKYNFNIPEPVLSLSIGSATATTSDEFDKSLELADELMYKEKKIKKANSSTI